MSAVIASSSSSSSSSSASSLMSLPASAVRLVDGEVAGAGGVSGTGGAGGVEGVGGLDPLHLHAPLSAPSSRRSSLSYGSTGGAAGEAERLTPPPSSPQLRHAVLYGVDHAFDPHLHWYPRALNAQLHPMVDTFLSLGNVRMVERYCHLNPSVAKEQLLQLLTSQALHFPWSGADLFNVTNSRGKRQMIVVETNSCPSGQKSMPSVNAEGELDGYHSLIRTTFQQRLDAAAAQHSLPAGALAVVFDKNDVEASGYAAAMVDVFHEPVYLAEFYISDPDPPVCWREGVMHVRDEAGDWVAIRAAFRYVTQKPWQRIPLDSKTLIVNPVLACLPERDTRLLTDTGFLFLADIERRIDAGQQVLYACYDTSTQSIVYKPGRVVEADRPTRWVDFTQADTRSLWDATSDDYGSTAHGACSRLTLRTTPEHDMYVQLCTGEGEDGHEPYEPRMAGGAPLPPHKMPARELAPGYQCSCVAVGRACTHGYSHYRMFTGAASGLQTPADAISPIDRDPHSPVTALGLQSKDELDAFLELFGCWLGHGRLSHDSRAGLTSHNAVCFEPKTDRERVHLQGLLARLHLERSHHFISSDTGLTHCVRVFEPRWFRFFDDEFGVQCPLSRRYDSRLALIRQGKHSSQRSPSAASPLSTSASATTSVSVASSTRALSASASFSLALSASASAELMDDEKGHDDDDGPLLRCQVCGRDDLTLDEDGSWGCVYCYEPVEDEDDPAKSAKWLPDWLLFRLDAAQLRLVIEGLRQADGRTAASAAQPESAEAGDNGMQTPRMICASGAGFRDQLIHACMHAGYSAYFQLDAPADTVRGYHAVPDYRCIHTQEEMEAALWVDSTRQFKPVRSHDDQWWVCYDEAVSELLPAQDVRFDGSGRVRQKTEHRQGWVAVHAVDGAVRQAATQSELAKLLSCACSEDSIDQARRRGLKVEGVWSIFTAAEYEQQRSGQAQQAATDLATQPGALYDEERDGRAWCVDVQHDDHLIFVQRARCDASGVVTHVGRSMVIGNCLAGGRNKMIADKAYEFFNNELSAAASGLAIRTPETVRDVSKTEIPLWVHSMGGHAVIKVPYSNAGQGVFTITSSDELSAFMSQEHHYDKFIVQSLVGNASWSSTSRSRSDLLFHCGTLPNKRLETFVCDLRCMIASTQDGFTPIAVYARRALLPLKATISSADDSWKMLGTNLSIRKADGGWTTDTARLLLMDSKDFNRLGIAIDDLIEAVSHITPHHTTPLYTTPHHIPSHPPLLTLPCAVLCCV